MVCPRGQRRPFTLPVTSIDALGISWPRMLVMDIDVLGVSRTMKCTLIGSAGSRYEGLEPEEKIKNWKDTYDCNWRLLRWPMGSIPLGDPY